MLSVFDQRESFAGDTVKPLRISFTGASGTGKSTIATYVAEHYGIPFIPFADMIGKLQRSTCTYQLCAGHPPASVHYLWSQQLLQAFEAAESSEPGLEQRQLPERLNSYSYGWEGDMTTVTAPSSRIAGNRFIVEDTVFNVWAVKDADTPWTIRIDGKECKDAGRGYPMSSRDIRNSTFVYGKLSLGDRHIVEIVGQNPKIASVDFKTCTRREFFGMGSPRWKLGGAAVVNFKSDWGAPYGTEAVTLAPGSAINIEVDATDISVAFADDPKGGELVVSVDGQERLSIPSNQPFIDSDGKNRYMENRRGICGLVFGKHNIALQVRGGPVTLLGLFTYDSRGSGQNVKP